MGNTRVLLATCVLCVAMALVAGEGVERIYADPPLAAQSQDPTTAPPAVTDRPADSLAKGAAFDEANFKAGTTLAVLSENMKLYADHSGPTLIKLVNEVRDKRLGGDKAVKYGKVLVVGGGPAGLVAALNAYALGSEVHVWEKRNDHTRLNLLGGADSVQEMWTGIWTGLIEHAGDTKVITDTDPWKQEVAWFFHCFLKEEGGMSMPILSLEYVLDALLQHLDTNMAIEQVPEYVHTLPNPTTSGSQALPHVPMDDTAPPRDIGNVDGTPTTIYVRPMDTLDGQEEGHADPQQGVDTTQVQPPVQAQKKKDDLVRVSAEFAGNNLCDAVKNDDFALHADLVIAADGLRSTVRMAAGLDQGVMFAETKDHDALGKDTGVPTAFAASTAAWFSAFVMGEGYSTTDIPWLWFKADLTTCGMRELVVAQHGAGISQIAGKLVFAAGDAKGSHLNALTKKLKGSMNDANTGSNPTADCTRNKLVDLLWAVVDRAGAGATLGMGDKKRLPEDQELPEREAFVKKAINTVPTDKPVGVLTTPRVAAARVFKTVPVKTGEEEVPECCCCCHFLCCLALCKPCVTSTVVDVTRNVGVFLFGDSAVAPYFPAGTGLKNTMLHQLPELFDGMAKGTLSNKDKLPTDAVKGIKGSLDKVPHKTFALTELLDAVKM